MRCRAGRLVGSDHAPRDDVDVLGRWFVTMANYIEAHREQSGRKIVISPSRRQLIGSKSSVHKASTVSPEHGHKRQNVATFLAADRLDLLVACCLSSEDAVSAIRPERWEWVRLDFVRLFECCFA